MSNTQISEGPQESSGKTYIGGAKVCVSVQNVCMGVFQLGFKRQVTTYLKKGMERYLQARRVNEAALLITASANTAELAAWLVGIGEVLAALSHYSTAQLCVRGGRTSEAALLPDDNPPSLGTSHATAGSAPIPAFEPASGIGKPSASEKQPAKPPSMDNGVDNEVRPA